MHELLLPATFVGNGTFRGQLYDVGRYPAAVLAEMPGGLIHGEVYRLGDPGTTLARLDAYEGCTETDPEPHEYLRAAVPVRLETGETVSAQVYLYNHPVSHLTVVESGDYLLWCARASSRDSGPN